MAPTLYFEDATPGLRFPLAAHTITEDEIIDFARKFDPQPFHTDVQAAAGSGFGGLVASGWHTAALAMRLVVEGVLADSATFGSPGVDNLRWLIPVRPGDTLTGSMTVLEARPSTTRPDRGLVRTRVEITNQRGDVVCTMDPMVLYRRRNMD